MKRRTLLAGAGAGALTGLAHIPRAFAADTVGITATSIKVGNTSFYTGPGSSYGVIGRTIEAYCHMLNDHGGIAGRKIDFITYDDAYSPPRTVQQTRRLVEQDHVALILSGIGTPTQTAVHEYLNKKKVPQLFVSSGATKWGDPKHFPWTMGWQPSYSTEAGIYIQHLMKTKPDAKLAVIYQNDDFGKDYLDSARRALGANAGKIIVKAASYEIADPSVESQVVACQGSGADALLVAAIPKFAVQVISKVYALNWKPIFYMTNVANAIGAVMRPAGPEKAIGMISTEYRKDPTDPVWDNDKGLNDWRAFMRKYYPSGDLTDNNNITAYGIAYTFEQVLKQCGHNLTHERIMQQAANLKDFEVPILLPGVKVNTSPTNFFPVRSMQLQRWDGKKWNRFGPILTS